MKIIAFCLGMVLSVITTDTWADEAAKQRITQSLQQVLPGIDVTRIRLSRIENLYEVMLGPEVVYATGDGRFILKGDLIDMQARRNLSEDSRSTARAGLLHEIPAAELIEFAPKHASSAIYVFTDTECGYCRTLHRDVPYLNRNGVAVKYLAFPRAGADSPVYQQMVAVWCAEDRRQALTDAKNGRPVSAAPCNDPIAKQYALGQKLGVRGTPGIFLENGQQLPGYMPPDDLLKVIRE